MTNREIDKIFSMLDKGNLEQIKDYLNKEKENNTNTLRQETFEEYLTNSKFGFDDKRIPRLFSNENIQFFTNGVSLYQINSNFFDTNTTNLSLQKNKKRAINHKFKIVDESLFKTYFKFFEEKYGNIASYYDSMYCKDDKQYTYVDYVDIISGEVLTKRFDTDEIDKANIILDSPTYKISNSYPILYAENNIGKVYILGYKNTYKE